MGQGAGEDSFQSRARQSRTRASAARVSGRPATAATTTSCVEAGSPSGRASRPAARGRRPVVSARPAPARTRCWIPSSLDARCRTRSGRPDAARRSASVRSSRSVARPREDQRVAGERRNLDLGIEGKRVAGRHQHRDRVGVEPPAIDPFGEGGRVARDGDVQFALEQALVHAVGVALRQAQFDAAEAPLQLRHDGHEQRCGRTRADADAQDRPFLAMEADRLETRRLRRVPGLLQHGQHRAAELAELGQAAFPEQQLAAELLLQSLDGLGQRGLGDVAGLGGTREVQRSCQSEEVADLGQVHGRDPRRRMRRWRRVPSGALGFAAPGRKVTSAPASRAAGRRSRPARPAARNPP